MREPKMRHKASKILRLSRGLKTNEQQVPRIKEAVAFLNRVLGFLVVRAGQDNRIYFLYLYFHFTFFGLRRRCS